MKFRIGFVSNSSSSSFVVIGLKVSHLPIEELKRLVEKTKLYAEGEYFDDGRDFFQMNLSMLKLWEQHAGLELKLYRVDHMFNEESPVMSKDDLPDNNFTIMAMSIDFHQTNTVKEFRERYVR